MTMSTTKALALLALLTVGVQAQASGHRPEGAFMGAECQGYTWVATRADGMGGTYEQRIEKAYRCGYRWYEPEGKRYKTRCWNTTKVIWYHDGNGGYFLEKEYESLACGWQPPSLITEVVDNTYGDRFRPVVVKVDATSGGGRKAPWSYSIEYGRAVKVDQNTLHIYGDGREWDSLTLTIRTADYEDTLVYDLRKEPRCAVSSNVDCEGYTNIGHGKGLIYYGADDTTMVTVEYGQLHFDPTCEAPPDAFNLSSTCGSVTDPYVLDMYAERVEEMNQMMRQSGIYIRFELKWVKRTNARSLFGASAAVSDLAGTADGVDTSTINISEAGTCGLAFLGRTFMKDRPKVGMAQCSTATVLHELGHTISLHHGPDNIGHAGTGALFPTLGHGTSDGWCGTWFGDIMSYHPKRFGFFNHLETCANWTSGEHYPAIRRALSGSYVAPDAMAGDPDVSSPAYVWNRVRYDLSLINEEDEITSGAPSAIRSEPVPFIGDMDDDLIIID